MEDHLQPILPDNPGFDPGEPNAKGLTIFIVAFVVMLVVIMVGTAVYFDWALDHQESEAILTKPSEDLAAVRAREEAQLKTYGYIDQAKGQIQIPIDRAMELIAKEAADGKVKWNTTPTQVKKIEDVPGTPAAPGAAAVPLAKN